MIAGKKWRHLNRCALDMEERLYRRESPTLPERLFLQQNRKN
ncbi:hypothetical protein AVDCRST_MAG81-3468 [uncultured Synechococcales cyanobacterium]|uniref:Uncharacterized protein n=1 Tax=uncultured Synechococcales cyanobacterium TaxID=1936017 RepID=A0A6J4VV69_9CYAN|nr:hypothetical protein AVDCRST_MAG81-3468 [uncultured Synechococcales cyanobacterium]